MDGIIIEMLQDKSGKVRPMPAQDYARLTPEEKGELQKMLESKGETLEQYEERVKRLSPPKIIMPSIQWVKR